MSKHDHVPPAPACRHEKPSEHHKGMESTLRFCAQCDVVECTACGHEWTSDSKLREWGKDYYNSRKRVDPQGIFGGIGRGLTERAFGGLTAAHDHD